MKKTKKENIYVIFVFNENAEFLDLQVFNTKTHALLWAISDSISFFRVRKYRIIELRKPFGWQLVYSLN